MLKNETVCIYFIKFVAGQFFILFYLYNIRQSRNDKECTKKNVGETGEIWAIFGKKKLYVYFAK